MLETMSFGFWLNGGMSGVMPKQTSLDIEVVKRLVYDILMLILIFCIMIFFAAIIDTYQ